MRIKIIVLFLFVALQNLYGQNAEGSNTNQFFDPLKNKNHWGVNTQFAFDRLFGLRETPVEIIYKRQKTENKATRLGLQLYYDHNNEKPYPTAPDRNTIETNLTTGVFWGKEKQHFIGNSPRWQWYYGADFNFIFTYSRQYLDEINNPHLREYTDERHHKYGASIKPFVGLRFEVTPNIYVSGDMLASAQFEAQRVRLDEKSAPNVFPKDPRWEVHNYYGQLNFYPITRLSIFVKLQ
ncbi:MAG: hypothetical protein KF845_13365 [Cyclobacteriaceae bacterium]|nr:hypothetical protein [Cyclobacteriaceae bacterium]